MPDAGSYTPKIKVGQTITWAKCPDVEAIVFATYRGMYEFSNDYRNQCPNEFDESEPSHVMYACWHNNTKNYYWINEEDISEILCTNCNRGKRMLLQPDNFDLIRRWFNFSREGAEKYREILLNQPTTDS